MAFMIWSPALIPEGRRVETIAGHVDVNPTVLDMLGVPPPTSWEGRSVFAADREFNRYGHTPASADPHSLQNFIFSADAAGASADSSRSGLLLV